MSIRPTTHEILVAGGAGFIGSHLCATLLDAGHRVLCVDNLQTSRSENLADLRNRKGFEFLHADITGSFPDLPLLSRKRFSRIYNLACAASPPQYQADPEHTMLTNVLGTRNLLRLAETHGARFLLTSTSEVYGDPDVHPQPESYRGNVNCTGPRACYDEGKRAAEALTFDFARLDRAEVRVARIFNTYGPNMRPDDGRVMSNFLCQALGGEAITIYGDGSQTRSFCYVTDMVEGLIRLMEAEGRVVGPVNLGNPTEVSVRKLAEEVLKVGDRRAAIQYRPLPTDDPKRRRPNIDLAEDLLGWKPGVSLEAGMGRTRDYFAKILDGGRLRRSMQSERAEAVLLPAASFEPTGDEASTR